MTLAEIPHALWTRNIQSATDIVPPMTPAQMGLPVDWDVEAEYVGGLTVATFRHFEFWQEPMLDVRNAWISPGAIAAPS